MRFKGMLAGAIVAGGALGVSAASAQPLPTDERLVTGKLNNGLKYIVLKHDNPPGRASVWLHVGSGSLNETDKQRGIAHYLEHMAFNGSKNFPPGSVVPFFQSLGLSFGRDQNAFTSFDQTTFQLALPNNEPETLKKAFTFMSDVAFNLALSPDEIDNERQVIMEEKRTRLGAQQRIQDYSLERIAPGSLIGERLPIGIDETIMGVKHDDFTNYYGHWYVPSNMTVMVVADMDPKVVVGEITEMFGQGESVPVPTSQDVRVKPSEGMRAIVASDPELSSASVSVFKVDKPRAPTTTVELARDELVDVLGTFCFNRRIQAKLSEGGTSYLSESASSSNMFNAARMKEVEARGKPEKWKEMLAELGTDLQRARLHGFSPRELDDVKKQMMSGAERAVEQEKTQDTRAILGRMNRDVAEGEPIMSAQQELDLYKKIMPGITVDEVNKRFTELFDMSKAAVFSVELPTSAGVPTEAELVSLGKTAVDVKPEAVVEKDRPTTLLSKAPAPGKVVESATHEGTGVTSAWLSNGVRVHQRFMDYKKDQVTVTINFAWGSLMETAANRGVSEVAALAWNRPATSTLSSTNIRDLMTGKKVRVGGGAGGDTMTLTVSGNPGELEDGMQLAYLLMTDPVIEKAALDQWRDAQIQEIQGRDKDARSAFPIAMADTIFPEGEARLKPLAEAQVKALTVEAGHEWMTKMLATAPIEVGVVGDMPKDKVMELVQKYIGALPAREKISDKTFDQYRSVKRPVGPRVTEKTIKTQTNAALVLAGFYGADAENLPDTRRLGMASRIMTTRFIKKIREEDQLVYSISATNQPGRAVPGFGLFFAAAPTEPHKVPALAARLDEMYGEFAKGGPTEEELEVGKKQMANTFDEQMKEPRFWDSMISDMDYRARKLDDVVNGPAYYQAMTASDVKDAFAKYYSDKTKLRVVVQPDPASLPANPEGGDKPADKPAPSKGG
jgi:zinc protease